MTISHNLVTNVSAWFFWNTVNFVDFFGRSCLTRQCSDIRQVRWNAQDCIANLLLSLSVKGFLPCDAMRCTVLVIVILSVCLSVRLSVCLSVRHTRGLCPHGSTYDHDFFTTGQPHHSSFWGYHLHPKIQRESPQAMALNEGGVGTNRRFSTNKSPYLRNGARYDKGYY